MPAEKSARRARRPPPGPEPKPFVPQVRQLEKELDRQAKLLLSALTDAGTLMAGMQALRAFRAAADAAVRSGPRDPEVRRRLAEGERAFLMAVQEASRAMLERLDAPSATAASGEEAAAGSLVEVPVERTAPPPAAPRARAPRGGRAQRRT